MRDLNLLTCPYCGEPIDTDVDPGAGARQAYLEDCAVCCRPVKFSVEYCFEKRTFEVTVSTDG